MDSKTMELRKKKAKAMRYKKPIAKDLNLETIRETLWNIQEECENVHWYFDTDDDTLISAMLGDESEAYEFRMMFGDLCAEVEQLLDDLNDTWVPECYDILFVAAGAGENFGGLLGFDTYEQDYYGIDCSDAWAEDEAKKKLMNMKKEELIAAIRQCFAIHTAYIALSYRYDCLKASMDVLKSSNSSYLKQVRKINELYEEAVNTKEYFKQQEKLRQWEAATANMPQEAWIS